MESEIEKYKLFFELGKLDEEKKKKFYRFFRLFFCGNLVHGKRRVFVLFHRFASSLLQVQCSSAEKFYIDFTCVSARLEEFYRRPRFPAHDMSIARSDWVSCVSG